MKPVQSKDEIYQRLLESQTLLKKYGTKKIGLFGSFVRGTQTPASDVDLLIEFEEGKKSFDHFMNLALLLEDILQRKVELVTPASLSPHIGPHILSEVDYAPLFS